MVIFIFVIGTGYHFTYIFFCEYLKKYHRCNYLCKHYIKLLRIVLRMLWFITAFKFMIIGTKYYYNIHYSLALKRWAISNILYSVHDRSLLSLKSVNVITINLLNVIYVMHYTYYTSCVCWDEITHAYA